MSFSADQVDRIKRAKMNAVSGKIMHTRALKVARFRSQIVNYCGRGSPDSAANYDGGSSPPARARTRVSGDRGEDIKVFGEISEGVRREGYRLVLREMGSGTTCSCGASPWNFQAGPCQICGGTPVAFQGAK
jgi:hypothetical protein